MKRLLNINTLTETQKNALFAFGDKSKAKTGCNLMVAADMCESDLTRTILMVLADLINSAGFTDEEFDELLYQIRHENIETIMKMQQYYQGMTHKLPVAPSWRGFAKKKILAAFGDESCGNTVLRLRYIGQMTADPDLKQTVYDLTSEIATMHVLHPENYQNLLKEAREGDELWKIRADDEGYFVIRE